MSNMTGENLSERIRILGRKVFKKQEQVTGRLTLEQMKASNELTFQGLTFDFHASRILPKEALEALNRSSSAIDLDQYEALLNYLKTMHSFNLLEPGAVKGNVVLVDDQYVTK